MAKQDYISKVIDLCCQAACEAAWYHREALPRDFKRISLDSRACDESCAFLALKGSKLDGNDFIEAALRAGAPLVICTSKPDDTLVALAQAQRAQLVYCDDGVAFLQEFATQYRASLSCICVGITGSVGKTTTKEMAKAVCESTYKTHASSGNFNNELGLPLSLLSADEDCEILILEMGMSALGEIKRLAEIAQPNIGIITNVGVSHLGKLGSRTRIAQAKAELIEGLRPLDSAAFKRSFFSGDKAAVILHEQDDYYHWMCERYLRDDRVSVYTHVRKPEQEELSLDIFSRPSFNYYALQDPRHAVRVRLSVPGEHNIVNAQAVLVLAEILDIELERAAAALENKLPSSSRQDIIECRGFVLIDDSYNANPVSMIAAIKSLLNMEASGKKYVILGDMGELGEDEEALHASVGKALVQECLRLNISLKDELVLCCIGRLAAQIAQAARDLGMPDSSLLVCASYESSQAELAALASALQPGDLVLVKASRAASLERVVKGIQELVW